MNTIVIAQVLGIFFTVAGVSMLVNSKGTVVAVERSLEDKGILWLWGFLAVLIGAVVVVLNNVWMSGLSLLVTILGWIALIKGILILLYPNFAISLYKKFNKRGIFTVCGIVAIILGIVLLYW